MRDIGKNIKDLRSSAKMTQEELAEKLFVTRQTISNYETGKTRPDVDMIVKIGELLNADANAVIYGEGVAEDKKRIYLRVAFTTAIVILAGAALFWLNRLVTLYRANTYLSFFYSLVKLLMNPAAFLVLGWWFVDALSVFVQFKRPNHSIV